MAKAISRLMADINKHLKERRRARKALRYRQQEMECNYRNLLAREKERTLLPRVAPAGAFLSLNHINKIYENRIPAVHDFCLDAKQHEFIVLVGPSGCGKSTTLRMIAGLEDITAGDLFIDGKYCNGMPSKDRDIAMVFQSYALYPNKTAYENMAFALRIRHLPGDEIERRVKEAARTLEITDLLDRKPRALSGGQCQRVALGRAIVRKAKLFLMDEPLSNLDAKLRVTMRSELIKLHHAIGATTVYVTHDQVEAMTMASRIVVMKDGRIQQIGTPKEVYANPNNLFVASFLGSPAMNLLPGYFDNLTIAAGPIRLKVQSVLAKAYADFMARKLDELQRRQELAALPVGKAKAGTSETQLKLAKDIAAIKLAGSINAGPILLGIRPEDIVLTRGPMSFPLTVSVPELIGDQYILHAQLDGKDFAIKAPGERSFAAGDTLSIAVKPRKFRVFDAITGELIG